MSQEKKEDWSKREVGCLWRRQGDMLTGVLKFDNIDLSEIDPLDNQLNIIAFINRKKDKNDKKPNIVLYLSRDSNSEPKTSVATEDTEPSSKDVAENTVNNEEDDDEIPFVTP